MHLDTHLTMTAATTKRRALSGEALDLVTAMLRVMGEPTRIRLMWLLDELGGATVQELWARMATSPQNISRHLNTLWHAGLVSRARDGKAVRYELVDWTALWVVDQISASVADRLEAQQQRFHSTGLAESSV